MTPTPDLTAEIKDIWNCFNYEFMDGNEEAEETLALIEREKRSAVEEAFRRLALEPSYDDFLQDQQKVLQDLFPSSPC